MTEVTASITVDLYNDGDDKITPPWKFHVGNGNYKEVLQVLRFSLLSSTNILVSGC